MTMADPINDDLVKSHGDIIYIATACGCVSKLGESKKNMGYLRKLLKHVLGLIQVTCSLVEIYFKGYLGHLPRTYELHFSGVFDHENLKL